MRQILNTLFVTTQGTWLSQDGENVVVHLDRETSKKFPIHLFESIVCFGKVNATGPLMGFCGRKGVPISFLSENGRFLARVDGPVRGNVLLRREQYRTADDKDRSLAIAKSVLIGKIGNTRGGCGCFFGLLCGQVQAPPVFQRTLRTQRYFYSLFIIPV